MPGRPGAAVLRSARRLQQPRLARVERRQRTCERRSRRLDQRSDVGGEIGGGPDPQRRGGVAQPFEERRVVIEGCLDDRQAGRGALLTGVAEGRPDEIGHRVVDVGGGADDHRVLPARLAVEAKRRLPVEEHRRGRLRPGEHHGVDEWVGDESPADVAVGRRHELDDVGRYSRLDAQFDDERGGVHRLGCGLQDHALPAASAASTPPAGMANGKFHGEATRTVPSAAGRAPSMRASRRPSVGVVPGEVDRLGHLGVALEHRLAGLVGHRRQNSAAIALEPIGDGVQEPGTLGRRRDPTTGPGRRERSSPPDRRRRR